MPGDIISECPGDFIGIRSPIYGPTRCNPAKCPKRSIRDKKKAPANDGQGLLSGEDSGPALCSQRTPIRGRICEHWGKLSGEQTVPHSQCKEANRGSIWIFLDVVNPAHALLPICYGAFQGIR
jgi:hypothetical protein